MRNNIKILEEFSILIVDDHKMFIDGMLTILERNIKAIKNIYTAIDAGKALQCLTDNKIDLVITDINMPGMSGIDLTKIIKEKYSDIKVLVLTMDDSKSTVSELIEVEAEGYILKNSDKNELVYAITKIMNNSTYYSSSVIQILIDINKESNRKPFPAKKTETEDLSEREIEVVKLICDELTSEEIAEKLHLAKTTVDVHRKNILRKIQKKNQIGIYKYAVKTSLINA